MMRWSAISVLFLTMVGSACQPPTPAEHRLALGEGWTLFGVDTFTSGLPATVPGTVHTDLLASELIPDPFWRDNELKVQWVGEQDWLFRITFTAGPALLERERVALVFHGLDTFADVRLNDTPILSADNMFRRWEVEVGSILRQGENTLEVLLRSPLPPALEARAALPYELPAGNDRGDPPSRVFVRKAAYHYGWDWGPRLVTSGIWRPVELIGWSGARISNVQIVTDSITAQRAYLHANVEIQVTDAEAERRNAVDDLPVTLALSSPEEAFPDATVRGTVEPGANRFRVPFEIAEPRLWWPNGMGASHLYSVRTELRAGRRRHQVDKRIGLRTVELVTEPDSVGESFFFRVNGLPVFIKGANVVPLDHFTPRVTKTGYERLFQDVKRANMNMLRVWGGGIYEEDIFYDLADEHGILIWQDFMFANGMYPGDSVFLASVSSEARDQIRRLRNHPSLALWCGNNEMDEGWNQWGWARAYGNPEDSAAVWQAYDTVFHNILPDLVLSEDPGRAYWPSSPSLGWGDPESLNRGDAHYWGVWHGQEPFEVLLEKLPRFMSEFGFQAIPPLESVVAFTAPADRSLMNPVFSVHQKHPIGNEIIGEYLRRDYPVPSRFEDLLYVSQLLQARGMRMAFEAHRRAKPRTMGTLYWQLNDTWPVISWSSRDYFGRWKALHYAAREAFAPLLTSAVVRGDSVEVWLVSDLRESRQDTLRLELLDFSGEVLWEEKTGAQIGPNESRRVWVGEVDDLLGSGAPATDSIVEIDEAVAEELTQEEETAPGHDPAQDTDEVPVQRPDRSPTRTRSVLVARFGEEPEVVLFFARPVDLALGSPAIRIRVDGPRSTDEAGRYRTDGAPIGAHGAGASAEAPPRDGQGRSQTGEDPGRPDVSEASIRPYSGEDEKEAWVTVTLESDYLAKDVFLSLDQGSSSPHHFEENFLHLIPGRPRSVRLFTELPPGEVEDRLRLRTLAEIPQEGVPADSQEVPPDSVFPGA